MEDCADHSLAETQPLPVAISADDGMSPTLRLPQELILGETQSSIFGDGTGLADLFADRKRHPESVRPGTVLGSYTIIAELGRGGFGEVWLAEQKEPIRRLVALKTIRAGASSPEVISRFERERQALAMMEHENIAKVYDADEQNGMLFFAMEYVDGSPVTQFVQQRMLSLRQRLELFIPVCRAVHHAHQKMVLHRDLKPGNILVTERNGSPVPKVIDFGIAKPLAASHPMLEADSSALPMTLPGYSIGTPQYMSPEQARGAEDIDAKSDTYALGVILYELLVGEPPLATADLKKLDPHSCLDRVIHHEPMLPSTIWLSRTSTSLRNYDDSLGSDPKRISRSMRGDLDWIVAKALEKNRLDRYASSDKLADDIQAYLNDEPVSVGPPSFGYRWRKFYKRHKIITLASAVTLVAIIVGGGAAVWQRNEAVAAKVLETTARRLAEDANAAEVVARRLAQAREQEANAARAKEAEAREAETLARRKAEEAQKLAEAARDAEMKARKASDVAREQAEESLTFILFDMGNKLEALNRTGLLDEAATKAVEYLKALESLVGNSESQTRKRIVLLQNIGRIRLSQGRLKEAKTHFSEALLLAADRHKRLDSEESTVDLALVHNRLGVAAQALGDREVALKNYQTELTLMTQLIRRHPASSAYRHHIGTIHEHIGDVSDDPLEHYEQAAKLLKEVLVEKPGSIESILASATVTGKLAGLRLEEGDVKAAASHSDEQFALLGLLPKDTMDVRIRRNTGLAMQLKSRILACAEQLPNALEAAKHAGVLAKSIADADPGNLIHATDLSVAWELEAHLQSLAARAALKEGKPAAIKGAVRHLEEALQLARANEERFPSEKTRGQIRDFQQLLVEIQKLLK